MDLKRRYSLDKQKMDNLGFITTGSLIKVYKTCGNPRCRCHKDRTKRHGPYNIWTRKVNSKTVTRTLTDEQAKLVQECIDNMRKIEKIIEQMKDTSVRYIENYLKGLKVEKNSQKL